MVASFTISNRLDLRAINKGEEFKLEFDNLEMDEGKDEICGDTQRSEGDAIL